MVYGVCRVILRDPTDAEDAAQQTFLSAFRGLLAGQEPREPSAWLGTIARNECRRRLRDRSAQPLSLVRDSSSGDDTQREVARREDAEALCSALAELPPQQRDAILLREFYGLSYAEVAAALGVSGAAVESLLFRSRRRLQAQLRPVRAALGALTVPPSLYDSLARSLPGFGAGGGAGAVIVAKLGAAPLAMKLTAAALAVGTAGIVAGVEVETAHHAASLAVAAPPRSAVAPARSAHRPGTHAPVAQPAVGTAPAHRSHPLVTGSHVRSRDGSGGSGTVAPPPPPAEHRSGDGGRDGGSSGEERSGGAGSSGSGESGGSGGGSSSGGGSEGGSGGSSEDGDSHDGGSSESDSPGGDGGSGSDSGSGSAGSGAFG